MGSRRRSWARNWAGVLHAALNAGDQHDRALVDGYSRIPQSDASDAWGDVAEWSATNARRNMAAINEEDGGW